MAFRPYYAHSAKKFCMRKIWKTFAMNHHHWCLPARTLHLSCMMMIMMKKETMTKLFTLPSFSLCITCSIMKNEYHYNVTICKNSKDDPLVNCNFCDPTWKTHKVNLMLKCFRLPVMTDNAQLDDLNYLKFWIPHSKHSKIYILI